MELEELIGKYKINNGSHSKFHEDLSEYYNFSRTQVLSMESERKLLNVREMRMCQEYNINYSTFLSNLKFLTQYEQLTGERN